MQVDYTWKNETFGENGLLGRENKSEIVLRRYLLKALIELNPALPELAYQQAIEQIEQCSADKTAVRINKENTSWQKNECVTVLPLLGS